MASAASVDIRSLSDDLRSRLKQLESEEESVLGELALIREKKGTYEKLLKLEEGESPVAGPLFARPRGAPAVVVPKQDIHALVRDLLLRGITNKDAIIMQVEQRGHEKPGRSVNAALMTFKRYGHVEVEGPTGREFILTDKGEKALRREAEGT